MTQDQKDALEAVERLNDEMEEKFIDKLSANAPIFSIEFACDLTAISITLLDYTNRCLNMPDMMLYNSVNNDRIYYESTDSYETYYDLLKRKFKEIQEEFQKYKL
jgi:hypothetical protein